MTRKSLMITILIVLLSVNIAFAGDCGPCPDDSPIPNEDLWTCGACPDDVPVPNEDYVPGLCESFSDDEGMDSDEVPSYIIEKKVDDKKMEKIRERYLELRKKLFFRNVHGQFVFLTLEEMKQAVMAKEVEPLSQFIILDFFEMEEAKIESFHNSRIENFEKYMEMIDRMKKEYEKK